MSGSGTGNIYCMSSRYVYIISVLLKLSHDRRKRTVQWPPPRNVRGSPLFFFAPERKNPFKSDSVFTKTPVAEKFGLRRFWILGKKMNLEISTRLGGSPLPCISFAFCYNSICTYEQCLQRNTSYWSGTDLWISTQRMATARCYNTARTIPFGVQLLAQVCDRSNSHFFHAFMSKPGIFTPSRTAIAIGIRGSRYIDLPMLKLFSFVNHIVTHRFPPLRVSLLWALGFERYKEVQRKHLGGSCPDVPQQTHWESSKLYTKPRSGYVSSSDLDRNIKKWHTYKEVVNAVRAWHEGWVRSF